MMARAPDIAAFGGDVFNCDPNPPAPPYDSPDPFHLPTIHFVLESVRSASDDCLLNLPARHRPSGPVHVPDWVAAVVDITVVVCLPSVHFEGLCTLRFYLFIHSVVPCVPLLSRRCKFPVCFMHNVLLFLCMTCFLFYRPLGAPPPPPPPPPPDPHGSLALTLTTPSPGPYLNHSPPRALTLTPPSPGPYLNHSLPWP